MFVKSPISRCQMIIRSYAYLSSDFELFSSSRRSLAAPGHAHPIATRNVSTPKP